MPLKCYLGGNGDVESLMKNLKYIYRFDDYISSFLKLPNLEIGLNYDVSETATEVSKVLINEKNKVDRACMVIDSDGIYFRMNKESQWQALSTGNKLDRFDSFVAKGSDKLSAMINVV